ncbi:putative ribonuclease H-like domain-containing protein [Tanacetum coccineum]
MVRCSNQLDVATCKAQQLEPKLYDGNVIKNTSAIVIPDSEETLMLAEETTYEFGDLGKFDGKSDEGFFVGYSLSSKAFRVYNTRTRRVEENLHIGFLENKPMIEGNGPKWLFDIDSLTQSMNYVPVAAGTISNESADASYFDSPSKDVGNGEPKSAADDQKQVEDGLHNESDEKDKSEDDRSPKEVNAAGQHVNTASLEVNTGRAGHTLETTHVEFFSDEDDPKVDLENITNSYTEELLQFKLQQVWILVYLPIGKRAIGTKWVFRNKKDERGIMIRNKARFSGISNRCEGCILIWTIEEEVTQKEEGIFISQDKYVAEILKKFNYTDVKSASTLVDLEKPLVKDGDADDVDVHLLRSRIKIFLQKVLMLEGSVLGLKYWNA